MKKCKPKLNILFFMCLFIGLNPISCFSISNNIGSVSGRVFDSTMTNNSNSNSQPSLVNDSSRFENKSEEPPKDDGKDRGYSLMTDREFGLSLAVLLFCLAITFIEIHLIKTRQISPDASIKFVIVTLIISGALFLITAGFGDRQIAPAFGLMGTIAGYMLGKGGKSETE